MIWCVNIGISTPKHDSNHLFHASKMRGLCALRLSISEETAHYHLLALFFSKYAELNNESLTMACCADLGSVVSSNVFIFSQQVGDNLLQEPKP